MKVAAIDLHNDSLITLSGCHALPLAAAGSPIVSLEFRLDVYLLRQPDPALPSRNTQTIDSEFFRTLSLDPRHSRYVHKVIGTTWPTPSPTWTDDDGQPLRIADNRSQGARNTSACATSRPAAAPELRSGSGRSSWSTRRQTGGRCPRACLCATATTRSRSINDFTYIGIDAIEPRDRTGLQSLRNIDEISIVAAPGRTSATMQKRR